VIHPTMLAALLLAFLVAPSAAWLPQTALLNRRAVLGGAATAILPLPAFAKSKEKAKEEAVQKATAKEARQAMKEYKFAPRPVLEGNAETGYKYKEGTIGAGSQGEVAAYFKEKGQSEEFRKRIDPNAAYKAKTGEAVVASSAPPTATKSKGLSEDEKRINEALSQFKGQKDEMGRVIMADTPKTATKVDLDEDMLAEIEALRGKKIRR